MCNGSMASFFASSSTGQKVLGLRHCEGRDSLTARPAIPPRLLRRFAPGNDTENPLAMTREVDESSDHKNMERIGKGLSTQVAGIVYGVVRKTRSVAGQ
jgi:hypothetical protein